MKHLKRFAALAAAGALIFAISGIASAASVTPTFHDGNITIDGNGSPDAAACDADDALFLNGGDSPETSGTTTNGVTITVTYHSGDTGFDFVAEGGLVTIAYVKGADGYFEYNYGAGVASDTDLFAPIAGGSGNGAVVSHLVFCTAAETITTTTTEETTTEETTTTTTTEVSETTTTTFTGGTGGETDVPTEPNTAAIGTGAPSTPADSAWLLVVALGVLLGSVVVLTPAKARSRR